MEYTWTYNACDNFVNANEFEAVVNGKNVKDIVNKDKLCVVMGNEGKGVSPEVQQLCNDFIYINMSSECESLNVAVAASIIMYELS